MELPDDLYVRIRKLCEQANDALESDSPQHAEAPLLEALRLLPKQQDRWEAYTWICASLGEMYFLSKRYQEAKEALFDAMNGPDGNTNPFIFLRLGQVLFELGDMRGAQEYLARAHMLEGDELFVREDTKYLEFLKGK
ncbi:hypothetical protein J5J83_07595 [Azoarcus sp. L1K30]|uniref:tetratricopeptide repeat protein n=1 Tax=Azoarcus sp. L1K30 TaxID=2820277 RepID=UPI001B8207A6|nr:hypothetical protein [Azoarcus sp. L1K30]MBR0565976.1 hypothetical protein [Azoarcus sp. L1K30]